MHQNYVVTNGLCQTYAPDFIAILFSWDLKEIHHNLNRQFGVMPGNILFFESELVNTTSGHYM